MFPRNYVYDGRGLGGFYETNLTWNDNPPPLMKTLFKIKLRKASQKG